MLIQSQSIPQLHFVNISIHAKAVLFLPACQIHQAEYVTLPQVNTGGHKAPKSKKMKKVKSMINIVQQDAQVQHDALVKIDNSKLADKFDVYNWGLFINHLQFINNNYKWKINCLGNSVRRPSQNNGTPTTPPQHQ